MNSTSITGSRKRQQPICFRTLVMPCSLANAEDEPDDNNHTANATNNATNTNTNNANNEYCPHFLAGLQLIAHVIEPLRKALVHFYVSHRSKEVEKPEWVALLAFGRLFRDLITAGNASSGGSLASGVSAGSDTNTATTNTTSNNTTSNSNSNNNSNTTNSNHQQALAPVKTDRFFPVLYTCLRKFDDPQLSTKPRDVTEAVRILLQCLQRCCQTLPVTNRSWVELLDKACMGILTKQSLVGRRTPKPNTPNTNKNTNKKDVVLQRTKTERCMLWCPHELPIGDIQRIPKPVPAVATKKRDTNNTNNNNNPGIHCCESRLPTLLAATSASSTFLQEIDEDLAHKTSKDLHHSIHSIIQ
mmetsp:Transcript_16730/g.36483  ORF Transcript_16730/g.36483 Transcript_16730/m.36483 type:complete len:358 (-) Transcript_16730:13-1086(-)